MSDGLKTGLILGGAGVVVYLLYERSQAAAVAGGVPSLGGSGTLATSPGAGPVPSATPGGAAAVAAPPASSSGGRSTLGTIGHYTAIAAIAPIVYPTKAVVYGAKAVGSAVESAFKSIF